LRPNFLPNPVLLAHFSHEFIEYWTLRSGMISKACQLAIWMNPSEAEVIGVPTYARTALIGDTVRLPAPPPCLSAHDWYSYCCLHAQYSSEYSSIHDRLFIAPWNVICMNQNRHLIKHISCAFGSSYFSFYCNWRTLSVMIEANFVLVLYPHECTKITSLPLARTTHVFTIVLFSYFLPCGLFIIFIIIIIIIIIRVPTLCCVWLALWLLTRHINNNLLLLLLLLLLLIELNWIELLLGYL
jgi:hypothetical protein